jgi:NAD(P)-dependent dehydrogenase (short-subunit alcohol dehydrogenase family)
MAKVLIIGASRGIGLETVKAALLAGHNVRALARSAARIPIQDPGLEKVPGNALDSSTIRGALESVDVVVRKLGYRRRGSEAVVGPMPHFGDVIKTDETSGRSSPG